MTVIGLTGGIASGKSTVSAYLKEKGIPVFDADATAWEVEKAGQPCLQQLVQAFGKEILQPDGELDRSHMAQLAFHDPKILQQLNAIVHRAVEEKRDAFLQAHAGDPVVVLDAPLLLECGWEKKADTVWLVDIDPEEQIKRAMARSGMTRQEVVDRINKQMPLTEKRKKADTIIDNSGTLEQLHEKVDEALGGLAENQR
ncbi:dephospho-CoA kinase [Acidaminococcus timonensis]|uniref:dephospho-CoA kinase n=1 Tax=Acidaminococcus timonensis TaxID=1871002 RepID=UPI0025DCB9A2|nr:dephospho-CoA kinase [Acidaminococcus timonensis]